MADITKITDGRKWRRACWEPGAWIQANGNYYYFTRHDGDEQLFSPSQILATDWELFEEEKPELKPSLTFDEAIGLGAKDGPVMVHVITPWGVVGVAGLVPALTPETMCFLDLAERRGWRMEEVTDD